MAEKKSQEFYERVYKEWQLTKEILLRYEAEYPDDTPVRKLIAEIRAATFPLFNKQ